MSRIFIICFLGSCVLYFLLPYLCNTYLIPTLLKDVPLAAKEFSISQISPTTIRGDLLFKDRANNLLSIPKFEIHYTLRSLLKRQIDTVLLDSAAIQVQLLDNRPDFSAFSTQTTTSGPKSNTPALLLPVTINQILTRNCSLTLRNTKQEVPEEHEEQNYFFDGHFDLSYTTYTSGIEGQKILQSVTGNLQVRDDLQLSADIMAMLQPQDQNLHATITFPNLKTFTRFLPVEAGYKLQGVGGVDLQLQVAELQKITGYRIAASLSDFHLTGENFSAQNRAGKKILLEIDGNQKQANYTLTGLLIEKPERINAELSGHVDLFEETLTGAASLYSHQMDTVLPLEFTGRKATNTAHITYQLSADDFQLKPDLRVNNLQLNGSADISSTNVFGTLNATLSKVSYPKQELALSDISLNVGYAYPPQDVEPPSNSDSKQGSLKIDSIIYKNTPSAQLLLQLNQTARGLLFTSTVTTPFDKNLKLKCNGSAEISGSSQLHCSLPATHIDTASLPDYIGVGDGVSASGTLALDLNLAYSDQKLDGNVTAELSKGLLQSGDTVVSGIYMQVTIPQLSRPQSLPSQLCTVDSVETGKIKMSDGTIRFRLEDATTVFLERIGLNWCGGHVEAGSISLSTTMDSLETTLYCDRLGFTELLSQFGIEDTEGQGSLNGKLPIKINSDGLFIDNGFLFSTPGNSGIIRFHNTEQLQQSMPSIEQTPYLDYSMKALQNFAYNWTKLTFTTVDNDLLLAMQLDGKPEKPLPFGYRNGQIVPTNKGAGIQHPIRLDANFRLPLQDLLQYGENIQSLMENM